MPPVSADFEKNVFINCPFDDQYQPLLYGIVFCVQMAGLVPRSALEATDAGELRLEKIVRIIGECKYAIHDISRTQVGRNRLPRFNMPFELGLDLGCRKFGAGRHRLKNQLIMERVPHMFQRYISDIAGQDIVSHADQVPKVIQHVRNWLVTESSAKTIPGGDYIRDQYREFRADLPRLCRKLKLKPREISFGDYCQIVRIWLEEKA
jgi:hypothetical protein